MACEKKFLAENGVTKTGHQAVSESLSTLRLRCAEPVRFRLMIGILNSCGGSGELQYTGMRFINSLIESASCQQTRIYLQAELFAAGLEPLQMSKSISLTSPWHPKLLDEVKRWQSIYIDVERLQELAQSAEQYRSKLVILERKVEVLQEEKNVFTSIERRLQEKCANLQRELILLKKNEILEKRPVALPRQNICFGNTKKHASEDEGISSSETSSPVPLKNEMTIHNYEDDCNATLEADIAEIEKIVNNEENERKKSEMKDIKNLEASLTAETEIVVNLLPQPPKKFNKLQVHIPNTQNDGSDYDLYYVGAEHTLNEHSLPLQNDYELNSYDSKQPDIINIVQRNHRDDSNRQILNVIMNAKEPQAKDHHGVIENFHQTSLDHRQNFNGVFFMSELMSPSSKLSKPDIMMANGQNRSMLDGTAKESKIPAKSRQIFLPSSQPSEPQNLAFNNFKFKNTNVNPTLFENLAGKDNRAQSNKGLKVTDLISGLY